MIKAFFEVDFPDLRKIEENEQVIGNDIMENMAFVISDAEEGVKKLEKYINLGFTDIVLINSSPDREKLVKLLSEKVIQLVNNKVDKNKVDKNSEIRK